MWTCQLMAARGVKLSGVFGVSDVGATQGRRSPAFRLAGFALADRAVAVVDGDLGDGAEHQAAGGCEIEDAREDARGRR